MVEFEQGLIKIKSNNERDYLKSLKKIEEEILLIFFAVKQEIDKQGISNQEKSKITRHSFKEMFGSKIAKLARKSNSEREMS